MKLHIFLDNFTKIKLSRGKDLVFTNNYKIYNYYKKHGAFLSDSSIINEDFDVAENIKKTLDIFYNDTTIFQNTFYSTLYKPIYEILVNIKDIVNNYDINEVVLYGGSEHIFISTHFSEGEGKKKFYKSSWMMNPIIENWLNSNDIDYVWKYKKIKIYFKLLNYFRDQVIFIRVILIFFIKSIINIELNSKKRKLDFSKKTAVFTNLSLQYNYFKTLFHDINDDIIYIVPRIYRKKIQEKNVVYKKNNNIVDSLIMFFKSLTFFKSKSRTVKLYLLNNQIEFNTSRLTRSFKIMYFEYLFKKNEILKTISVYNLNNTRSFVTGMTVGFDIQTIYEVSKLLCIKHINFQYVAMGKLALPNLDLADEYYMYSQKTQEFYRKYNKNFKLYMPIIKYDRSKKKNYANLVVTIFTQPDNYTNEYADLIESIANEIFRLKLEIKLNIKLHYREDKIEIFRELKNKFNFINILKDENSVSQILTKSDIAISITSSVLFESMMNNVVGFIVDLEGKRREYIYNNDSCYPEVNFYMQTIEEVIEGFLNFKSKKHEYMNRLNTFNTNSIGEINYKKILNIK